MRHFVASVSIAFLLAVSAYAQGTPGVLRCVFNGGLDVHATRETGSPVVARIACGSPILLIDQRFGSPHVRTEDGKDGYILGLNIGQWSVEPETGAVSAQPAPTVAQPVRQINAAPSAQVGGLDFPRIEAYVGYSFIRPDLPNFTGDRETDDAIQDAGRFILGNVLGWGGSFTVNVTRVFGITGDFSEHRKSLESSFEGTSGKASANIRTFMGGATFKQRGDRVQPFGHVLAGLGRLGASLRLTETDSRNRTTTTTDKVHENGFAMIAGGGVDITVNDYVSVRAIEFDYFPYRTSGGIFTLHNLEWKSGIVFTSGQ